MTKDDMSTGSPKKIATHFFGSGVQAYGYFVDDDFIDRWGLSRPDSSGAYSSQYDHADLFAESDIEDLFICHGLHANSTLKIEVDGTVLYEGGTSLGNEQRGEERTTTPLAIRHIQYFADDYLIPEGKHLILEVTRYSAGTLSAELSIGRGSFDVNDLVLGVRGVISDSNIANAECRIGIFDEILHDIVELHHKDTSSMFELNMHEISGVDLYLIDRDSSGRWVMHHRISRVS